MCRSRRVTCAFDFLRSICHVEQACGAFGAHFNSAGSAGSLAILLAALAGVQTCGRRRVYNFRQPSHAGKGGSGHRLRSPNRPDPCHLESAKRIQRSLHSGIDREVSGQRRRPGGGRHFAFGKNPVPSRPAAFGRILSIAPIRPLPSRSIWPGALANSCNYFFSELSARLSSAALAHWYAVFGFGAAGEEAAPGEVRISG